MEKMKNSTIIEGIGETEEFIFVSVKKLNKYDPDIIGFTCFCKRSARYT